MNFKYDQPLVLKSGPQELKIVKMTTGTTTVQLSDGRMAWLTLSVDSVKPNAADSNSLDFAHTITVEIMIKPEFPVADAPAGLQ